MANKSSFAGVVVLLLALALSGVQGVRSPPVYAYSPPPPPCGSPPPPPVIISSPPAYSYSPPPPPVLISSPPVYSYSPPPPPCGSPPPPPVIMASPPCASPPPPPVIMSSPPVYSYSPPPPPCGAPPPPPPVIMSSPPMYRYSPPPPSSGYLSSPPPPPSYSYLSSPPPPPSGYVPSQPACGTLALTYSQDLSIFRSLVLAAGPDVVAIWENPNYDMSVLAPVNSAFAGVDVPALLADNLKLRTVLGNHILWGVQLPASAAQLNGQAYTTLIKTTLTFKSLADSYGAARTDVTGPKNTASLLSPRYTACRVVVQPISAVLGY